MIIADMFSIELYYGDRHLYGEFWIIKLEAHINYKYILYEKDTFISDGNNPAVYGVCTAESQSERTTISTSGSVTIMEDYEVKSGAEFEIRTE